jgi:hypothetical protein
MPVSTLKHKLEILDLEHKHAVELLKLKHTQERQELVKLCTHKYDDGTSAKNVKGDQREWYYECSICGKSLC